MENIELSAFMVTLIVSAVIPVLTGLLTKLTTPGWVKGSLTLFLNAVNALVMGGVMADGSAVLTKEAVVTALIGFVVSVSTYNGIYKPANLNSSSDGKLFPNRGLF